MYYCAREEFVDEEIRNHKNYIFKKGNLQNYNLILETLQSYSVTHIIHFAAQSHVQKSFDDSIQFTYDNVLGTHTLLEACRIYGKVQKFIHVSTDEVYGESRNDVDEKHKTEESMLCPTNPYAATKASAEMIVKSYITSYNLPIIVTRGNNVYGKNQNEEKLIPHFISLLKQNKKVTIQGNGNQIRAFLHVDDVVSAFKIILEKGIIGEIYNIGSDGHMEISVLNLAKLLISLIQKTNDYKHWIEYVKDRPFNDVRYYISNDKLKALGWKIDIDIQSGLKSLI
jgi:dTDP-glucose 4,6-dehydratase